MILILENYGFLKSLAEEQFGTDYKILGISDAQIRHMLSETDYEKLTDGSVSQNYVKMNGNGNEIDFAKYANVKPENLKYLGISFSNHGVPAIDKRNVSYLFMVKRDKDILPLWASEMRSAENPFKNYGVKLDVKNTNAFFDAFDAELESLDIFEGQRKRFVHKFVFEMDDEEYLKARYRYKKHLLMKMFLMSESHQFLSGGGVSLYPSRMSNWAGENCIQDYLDYEIKQGNKNVLNIFKSVNKGFCNREMLVKMYDVLSPEMQNQIDKHFQFLDKKEIRFEEFEKEIVNENVVFTVNLKSLKNINSQVQTLIRKHFDMISEEIFTSYGYKRMNFDPLDKMFFHLEAKKVIAQKNDITQEIFVKEMLNVFNHLFNLPDRFDPDKKNWRENVEVFLLSSQMYKDMNEKGVRAEPMEVGKVLKF